LFPVNPFLSTNDITAQDVLNWVLPALGIAAAAVVIYFSWRYLRKSDSVGRVSEFNEKTFKKLIKNEDQEYLPNCLQCKMPMRVEIRYRDFMKDTGDFLIVKETAEQTVASLVGVGRISEEDKIKILKFFEEHPELDQQLFRRYKCPNCSEVKVVPYLVSSTKE
jgi:hypothetical protein